MISKEPDCLRKWDCRSKLSRESKSGLCQKCAQTKAAEKIRALLRQQERLGNDLLH